MSSLPKHLQEDWLSGVLCSEQPGTREALLQQAVQAEHATCGRAHKHDVQQDQQPVVIHCRAAGGDGHREVYIGVVKGAEEGRDPHQASGDERNGDGHFTEGHQIAEEMSVWHDEAGDERTMPPKIIFGCSAQKFLGEPLPISSQKAASCELWPAHHKELHAHEDAHKSQIAEPSLLLRSIHVR